MENSIWEALDPQRSQLRALALILNRELSSLATAEKVAGRSAGLSSVQSAWAELERMLDFGPEPDLRACPSCQRSIMSAATRCRYCFAKSLSVP